MVDESVKEAPGARASRSWCRAPAAAGFVGLRCTDSCQRVCVVKCCAGREQNQTRSTRTRGKGAGRPSDRPPSGSVRDPCADLPSPRASWTGTASLFSLIKMLPSTPSAPAPPPTPRLAAVLEQGRHREQEVVRGLRPVHRSSPSDFPTTPSLETHTPLYSPFPRMQHPFAQTRGFSATLDPPPHWGRPDDVGPGTIPIRVPTQAAPVTQQKRPQNGEDERRRVSVGSAMKLVSDVFSFSRRGWLSGLTGFYSSGKRAKGSSLRRGFTCRLEPSSSFC